MEDDQTKPPTGKGTRPKARQFIFRSIDPEAEPSHPSRRSTDIPYMFRGVGGQPRPGVQLIKMRVYMKVN